MTLDPKLVRGLDYYEHTVFEVIADGIGAQNAVAGGGRYRITPPDGGPAIPGVGFAAGIERLLLARAQAGRCEGGVVAGEDAKQRVTDLSRSRPSISTWSR